MNRRNIIFFAAVAAILIAAQAFIVKNLNGLSKSDSFIKVSTEASKEVFRNQIKAHKREVESARLRYEAQVKSYKRGKELAKLGEILKGYRGLRRLDKSRLAEVILSESERHGLDPMLIVALIETESSFRSSARSRKGAKGLMQIRPFVGRSLAKELNLPWEGDATLFNPYINVQMGTYYFAKLLDNFDMNIDIALTAYNYGPSRINRLIRKGRNVPKRYARRVISIYEAKLSFIDTSLPLKSTGTL